MSNVGTSKPAAAPINFSHAKSMDIPMDAIIIDNEFNSRTNLDGHTGGDQVKVSNLADSLNTTGQATPILVEKRKVGSKDKYYLISGFRRVAAAQKLQWESIAARVFEPMSETARRYLNLLENTAREDLSSYDLAMACGALVKQGETSQDIAVKIGKGDSYVRNLANSAENASPAILDRWRRENTAGFGGVKALSTDWLSSTTSAHKGDFAAQDEELRKRLGSKTKKGDPDFVEGRSDGTGGAGEGGDKPDVTKRPNKIQLENAVIGILEKMKTEKDELMVRRMQGCVDALRWATGAALEIDGVWAKDEKLKA